LIPVNRSQSPGQAELPHFEKSKKEQQQEHEKKEG